MINKTKILIVEDETIVALEIKNVLNKLKEIKVTDTVTNCADALESIKEDEPDIVMMDVNLEDDIDGIDTVNAIYKIKKIPIIYLTAFSDDKTLNRAIETTPLNYMLKPFKREELRTTMLLSLYKIKQLDKSPIIQKDFLHIGHNYYYDIDNQALYYENIPMKLSQKERKLLSILVESRGYIVPFEQLTYEIWPNETISDSTLRTLIYRVRVKLEYKLIETIPAFGCKLTAES